MDSLASSTTSAEKKFLRMTPVESEQQPTSTPASGISDESNRKKTGFSLWDVIAPTICCCSRKDGYEEIGSETVEEHSQKIRDLQNTVDMLNDQLQIIQSSGEMQRLLQERLVEQVHELDDLVSDNRSQLINEIQEVSEREMLGRSDLKEAILKYIEEDRLKEIEDVLSGHSNNTDQMVEQLLALRNRVVGIEDDLGAIASAVNVEAKNSEDLNARVRTCEVLAENIGDNIERDEHKQSSSLLHSTAGSHGDKILRRIETLETTVDIMAERVDQSPFGEGGGVAMEARLSNVEEKLETTASTEYVDSLVKSLEEGRNQFITKTVERTTVFHIEMTKKELSQKQGARISEIEGKLEGLRVLVAGLVKSVETRDAELTQMNRCYFDELQEKVNETSEELRNTFTEFKLIKRKFEEQNAVLNIAMDQSSSSNTTGELSRKLNNLENRVDHVVDKLVELSDKSPTDQFWKDMSHPTSALGDANRDGVEQ